MSNEAFAPRPISETTTQSCGTPGSFLGAIEKKFQVEIGFDIACTSEDCVAVSFTKLPNSAGHIRSLHGYFFDKGVNALDQDWSTIEQPVSFLNPPFAHIAPWVRQCSSHSRQLTLPHVSSNKMTRIFSLLPAGVGTDWFARYVEGKCAVYFLRPRLKFVNPLTGKPFTRMTKDGREQEVGINRDCMLLDWLGEPGMKCWKWTDDV